MPNVYEIVIALLMVGGTFFIVVAGIGLVRFPDIYCRMHAAGKAGTLGITLLILATVAYFTPHDFSVATRGLLAIFFQYLTTPAGAHLLARACYINDYPLSERTAVDELKIHLPSRPDDVVTWSE